MLSGDESAFWESLRERLPYLQLIDGITFSEPEAVVRSSISECRSHTVLIWDPVAFAEVPLAKLRDRWQVPVTKYVLRWIRSVLREGPCLESGDIEVTYEPADAQMAETVGIVYSVLRSSTSNNLCDLEGKRVSRYRLGPLAAARARDQESAGGVFLRHASTQDYFRVMP